MVTAYFVDSSALVKRNVQETGTTWIRRLTSRNPSPVIYISHITAVEVTCAVPRRKGKNLTPPRASSILGRFRQHLDAWYTVIEVLDEAMRLGHTQALRKYDAVQLAVALEVEDNRGQFIFHRG